MGKLFSQRSKVKKEYLIIELISKMDQYRLMTHVWEQVPVSGWVKYEALRGLSWSATAFAIQLTD